MLILFSLNKISDLNTFAETVTGKYRDTGFYDYSGVPLVFLKQKEAFVRPERKPEAVISFWRFMLNIHLLQSFPNIMNMVRKQLLQKAEHELKLLAVREKKSIYQETLHFWREIRSLEQQKPEAARNSEAAQKPETARDAAISGKQTASSAAASNITARGATASDTAKYELIIPEEKYRELRERIADRLRDYDIERIADRLRDYDVSSGSKAETFTLRIDGGVQPQIVERLAYSNKYNVTVNDLISRRFERITITAALVAKHAERLGAAAEYDAEHFKHTVTAIDFIYRRLGRFSQGAEQAAEQTARITAGTSLSKRMITAKDHIARHSRLIAAAATFAERLSRHVVTLTDITKLSRHGVTLTDLATRRLGRTAAGDEQTPEQAAPNATAALAAKLSGYAVTLTDITKLSRHAVTLTNLAIRRLGRTAAGVEQTPGQAAPNAATAFDAKLSGHGVTLTDIVNRRLRRSAVWDEQTPGQVAPNAAEALAAKLSGHGVTLTDIAIRHLGRNPAGYEHIPGKSAPNAAAVLAARLPKHVVTLIGFTKLLKHVSTLTDLTTKRLGRNAVWDEIIPRQAAHTATVALAARLSKHVITLTDLIKLSGYIVTLTDLATRRWGRNPAGDKHILGKSAPNAVTAAALAARLPKHVVTLTYFTKLSKHASTLADLTTKRLRRNAAGDEHPPRQAAPNDAATLAAKLSERVVTLTDLITRRLGRSAAGDEKTPGQAAPNDAEAIAAKLSWHVVTLTDITKLSGHGVPLTDLTTRRLGRNAVWDEKTPGQAAPNDATAIAAKSSGHAVTLTDITKLSRNAVTLTELAARRLGRSAAWVKQTPGQAAPNAATATLATFPEKLSRHVVTLTELAARRLGRSAAWVKQTPGQAAPNAVAALATKLSGHVTNLTDYTTKRLGHSAAWDKQIPGQAAPNAVAAFVARLSERVVTLTDLTKLSGHVVTLTDLITRRFGRNAAWDEQIPRQAAPTAAATLAVRLSERVAASTDLTARHIEQIVAKAEHIAGQSGRAATMTEHVAERFKYDIKVPMLRLIVPEVKKPTRAFDYHTDVSTPDLEKVAHVFRRNKTEKRNVSQEKQPEKHRETETEIRYLYNKEIHRETELNEQKQSIKELTEKLETQEKILRQMGDQRAKLGKTEMKALTEEIMTRMEKELRLERQRRGLL